MKLSVLLIFLMAITGLQAEIKKGENVEAFNANDDKGLLWTSKESFNKEYLIQTVDKPQYFLMLGFVFKP